MASSSIVLSLFMLKIRLKHVCDSTASELLSLHASLLRRCDVANFTQFFSFRFSVWTLFDTQLMNFIRKYVLLLILDF